MARKRRSTRLLQPTWEPWPPSPAPGQLKGRFLLRSRISATSRVPETEPNRGTPGARPRPSEAGKSARSMSPSPLGCPEGLPASDESPASSTSVGQVGEVRSFSICRRQTTARTARTQRLPSQGSRGEWRRWPACRHELVGNARVEWTPSFRQAMRWSSAMQKLEKPRVRRPSSGLARKRWSLQ